MQLLEPIYTRSDLGIVTEGAFMLFFLRHVMHTFMIMILKNKYTFFGMGDTVFIIHHS